MLDTHFRRFGTLISIEVCLAIGYRHIMQRCDAASAVAEFTWLLEVPTYILSPFLSSDSNW